MTLAITPVTAADGTFSGAGAAAWAAGMNATMGANALLGNNTGAGAVLELTAAQAKALLVIASGDVSGLAASATTDTTNASNISSGTLPAGRLPTPAAATLGGVNSKAAVSHQFLTGIGTDGSVTQAQPAAADVSGLAASATTDTTNAANISSGKLPAARLPIILLKTGVAVSAAADLTEDTVSTITLPAMTANEGVDLDYLFSSNNNANNKIFKVYLGGGPGTGTLIFTRTQTTATSLSLKLKIMNAGATNAQKLSGFGVTSAGTLLQLSVITAAVQTNAGTTIVATAQKATSTSDTATCEMVVAQLLDDGT